jgi:glucose-6-phosphate 1-dehydrogenase
MTIATHPQVSAGATTNGHAPADVLVVFGITGDLAKVMTFRSLYRLEKRGLIDCPIVGVAVDDWTVADLRRRARESIAADGAPVDEEVFGRLSERLSYIQGDFGDAGTFGRVAAALDGKRAPVFYLEIPPFLFGTVVSGLAAAGLTANARVVVEKPFGHDVASAQASTWRSTATSTSRSCTGSTTSWGRWGSPRSSTSASRTRSSSRSGVASTSPASRSRWRRTSASRTAGTSTTRSGAVRDVVVNHLMQVVGRRGDGAAVEPAGAQGRSLPGVRGHAGGRPGALRARAVRRLPGHRRRRRRLRHRDLRRDAPGDRQLALGGRAVHHPHRQAPAGDPDRAAAHLPPPAAAVLPRRPVAPARAGQLVVRLDPSTGVRLLVEAQPAGSRNAEQFSLDLEFAQQGGEGPTPYEVLLHAAMLGDSTRFTRQDSVEETWRVLQPLLDNSLPVHPYAKGSWGPAEADKLVAGYGGWHGPWVGA